MWQLNVGKGARSRSAEDILLIYQCLKYHGIISYHDIHPSPIP